MLHVAGPAAVRSTLNDTESESSNGSAFGSAVDHIVKSVDFREQRPVALTEDEAFAEERGCFGGSVCSANFGGSAGSGNFGGSAGSATKPVAPCPGPAVLPVAPAPPPLPIGAIATWCGHKKSPQAFGLPKTEKNAAFYDDPVIRVYDRPEHPEFKGAVPIVDMMKAGGFSDKMLRRASYEPKLTKPANHGGVGLMQYDIILVNFDGVCRTNILDTNHIFDLYCYANQYNICTHVPLGHEYKFCTMVQFLYHSTKK